MEYFNYEFTMDTPEGILECPAQFRVNCEWGPRNRAGYRRIDDANCALDVFNIGAASFNRQVAVNILGDSEVERQEALALTAWMKDAVENDAAEYADYLGGLQID